MQTVSIEVDIFHEVVMGAKTASHFDAHLLRIQPLSERLDRLVEHGRQRGQLPVDGELSVLNLSEVQEVFEQHCGQIRVKR